MITNEAEKKNEPIDPMTFMTEEEAKKKNADFAELEKALRFGVPALCDKLIAIYKKSGIDGLNKLDKILLNLYHINRILEGELEVDFEGCSTKEECIVALLTGDVDIDWKGIYNGTDGWEDPAEAAFSVDDD